MYFKNKSTGVTWHITDESHQKRLQANAGYVDVTSAIGKDATQSSNDEPVSDSDNQNDDKCTQSSTSGVDYSAVKWHDLRKIASDKGINTKGLKRDEIETQLKEIG